MNLIQLTDCWRADEFEIYLVVKNFDIPKNIRGFLETLFEYYFLNIIVNVNFFSDLNLNITVNTTLK